MNKRKITLEIKGKLSKGDVLVYEGEGLLRPVEIHDILPDLKSAKDDIVSIHQTITEMKKTIASIAKIIKEEQE